MTTTTQRPTLALASGILFLFLAGACASSGSGGSSSGPPTQALTLHELVIRRHTSVQLSDARADQILGEMGRIIQNADGPGDVACDVGFARSGGVTLFTTGSGRINSQTDFLAVNDLPGNIKVVNQINWCGTLSPNIIGCAPVPGQSLVVVRFAPNQESILWLHEFGHNQGLQHRSATDAVMSPVIGTTHRRVDARECRAYEN